MSTISKLRKVVAAYLQVPAGDLSVEIDPNTHETVDLLITAANNAKRFAQNRFDWESELAFVYVDTDAVGAGVWSSANRVANDDEVKVKQPQTFYLKQSDTDYYVPLYHHTKKHGAVQAKEWLDATPISGRRYLSDAVPSRYARRNRYSDLQEVYILGSGFELQPPTTVVTRVYMDAYLWFPDYTDDADTDELFLEKGFEFMQWATIVELNHHFQTFIPQQEGNLPPPVKARDTALEGLVEYNNFIVESGRQPSK